jgi:hypothetical protein
MFENFAFLTSSLLPRCFLELTSPLLHWPGFWVCTTQAISDWFKVKEHHLNAGEITIAPNQKINYFNAMMKLLRKASLWFTFVTGSASVPINSGLQKLLDPITISK